MRRRRVILDHRKLEMTAASTVSEAEPYVTTGPVCLQSPLNIIVLPPKRVLLYSKSCKDLFNASTQYLCVIGSLSQIMR